MEIITGTEFDNSITTILSLQNIKFLVPTVDQIIRYF